MRNRKPNYLNAEDRHSDRWIFSYTEVLTVLLTLFVALAAQVQGRKPPPVAAANVSPAAAAGGVNPAGQSARPAETPCPASPRPTTALLRMQDALRQRGIEPRLEARGLVVSLPQSVVFRSGRDQISPAAIAVIEQIADIVRAVPNRISLVGHADAVPIHNARFKSNWELSAARSLQLLQLLTARYGIAESRLAVTSYGSQNPRGSNQTEAGRAENRRVEIIIADELVHP